MDNRISFGDRVKVLETSETIQRKLANLSGEVYGETVPSISGVEVIGEVKTDFALNVHFEELHETYWFCPDLLRFIDHNQGLTIGIGDKEWIRDPNGNWTENKKGNNRKSLFDLIKRIIKSK